MKKALYQLLISLCPLFGLSKGFILKGNIDGLQTGTVTLAYVNDDGEDTTLTANIAAGAFTFSGSVPEPQLVRLNTSQGWSYSLSFFLENSAISMQLVKDAPTKTTITGSISNIIYEKLKPGQSTFFEHARLNESAHQQAAIAYNRQTLRSADSLWAAQQNQWIQSIRTTITADANNYAALYFTRWLLFRPGNYDTILSVFMQLSPKVRGGPAAKKFLAEFEHARKTSVGQPAPEINGKDTSGRPVRLAAFKGKVVLLDFWASYCGPCRQENKRMLSVYQKYHAAGFEIISFSMDDDRKFWLQAIQADGLIWPQASELRGGAGETGGIYEINDLPRNILIDRKGIICAKDLHGEELIDTLKDLLGKGK